MSVDILGLLLIVLNLVLLKDQCLNNVTTAINIMLQMIRILLKMVRKRIVYRLMYGSMLLLVK